MIICEQMELKEVHRKRGFNQPWFGTISIREKKKRGKNGKPGNLDRFH